MYLIWENLMPNWFHMGKYYIRHLTTYEVFFIWASCSFACHMDFCLGFGLRLLELVRNELA